MLPTAITRRAAPRSPPPPSPSPQRLRPLRVSRIEPAAVTDLSGRWNDTDSRLVANQLIEQTLAAGWTKRYTDAHGGEAPTIIVGTFANRTMEHIPVGTFVKDIENALVEHRRRPRRRLGAERGEIRAERKDQQQNARADTRSRRPGDGCAVHARRRAPGDRGRRRPRARGLLPDRRDAVDLETNAKVWVGQHKIKKYVERARFGL